MKIKLSSVMVDDQDQALKFYTEVLGFVKSRDLPAGEYRWLTVVSPAGPDDIELLLEPNANPAAKTYQKALFQQGIPLTAFPVEDIHEEYERLKKLGVAFRTEPTKMGPCGDRHGRAVSPRGRLTGSVDPGDRSGSCRRGSPRVRWTTPSCEKERTR